MKMLAWDVWRNGLGYGHEVKHESDQQTNGRGVPLCELEHRLSTNTVESFGMMIDAELLNLRKTPMEAQLSVRELAGAEGQECA